MYTLSAPGLPLLELHPSRVVRFLGNPLPDPSAAGAVWSDSVLQSLYDAVHAAALCLAGATSLLHEAKVDVVTVPNLSEHLSSAETTAQLSARFAYAAAMKSMNNLLLLGDGESWSRQSVDFAGLPEMARTFLQVAAGAADIPVTRLLGQSPASLSATGESDVRNYYDMIAARQELDLRPQLERLDRLICWSENIDEGALSFAFRPLWQLDEPAKAALALSRAQVTQVYAGLKLWPDAVVARLAEAQLVQDGTYPNAAAVFAEHIGSAGPSIQDAFPVRPGFDPDEPRDDWGRWMTRGGSRAATPPDTRLILVSDPEKLKRQLEEGEAGGPSPLDGPALPVEENPAIKPIPGAASHGPLENAPSPLTVLPVLPRTPALPPTVKPDAPAAAGTPPVGGKTPQVSPGITSASGQTSPGADPDTTTPFSAATTAGPTGRPQPAQSTAVPPSPPTPQSGALPSFEGRFNEPAKPGTYGASKALASIDIPANLRLETQGKTADEQGKFYQEEVRKALNFASPPKLLGRNKKGDSVPGGLFIDPETGLKIALEVKYFNKLKPGINDPDNMLKWISADDVAQARKYIDKFKGGLLWVCNDPELVYKYDYLFRKNGLSGFRIEYIGSKYRLTMSEKVIYNLEYVPPGCTAYDYGDPSTPFTPENTKAVNSITQFLSKEEVAEARKIEIVYYSPVFQTVGGVFIPGLRSYDTSFCLYIRRYKEIYYDSLLEEFMSAVCMGHPNLNPDTVHWDWFRVTTPGGDQYYPLEFHDDLEAWTDCMIAVAIEKGTTMGWFDKGKFCLNDGSRMAFGDLRIDRLKGGETIPDNW